ncbi:protein RRP5 homolog [Aplysia californica]|uniref:Protein RRP5 homolog n=1 Tax=Aplysia californica TaxID=6500 RepID=A0ABM0JI41_APLCA|nr:protein RRP5 homolog [Aplysia californica]
MWKAEEDFPRGGARKQKPQEDEGKGDENEELPVKKNANKQQKAIKRKRSDSELTTVSLPLKKVKKRSSEGHVGVPLHQCLTTELCVLGCVREAHEYHVSVSLPGNRLATLPITEISPAYTQQLQKLAQSAEPEISEDLKPVDEMFRPGLLVPVKVTTVEEDKQKNKTFVKLSSVPASLNSSLPLSSLTDGLLLFGSVSSVEDHGYRVDLGIKSLQAFLSSKDAEAFVQTYNSGEPLSVGQPLWCVLKMKGKSGIKEGETRAVNVTVEPTLVKQATLEETTSLNTVLPGMRVKAVIEKKTDTGLIGKVYNFEAVIHGSQVPKSPLTYKVKAEVDARVLYVHPVTKVLQLTALPELVNSDGGAIGLFQDLRVGNILEAKVLRLDKKKGVYFSLPKGVRAFAALSKLTDKTNEPDITAYAVGASHQCRILGFNFIEGVALVTLKQSILSQKFLTIHDVNIGDVVEATVTEVHLNGVAVTLSRGINSFIPGMHLADVPIKRPEKKFDAGMKLKCRVLRINHQKNKVILTHKKSLVKAKHPIITDYSELRRHMELEGVIVAVKERVVIVSLFGDVKGFVSRKYMSTEQVEDPTTLFYVGQVIRCRVVFCDAEQKKLVLSFNFGTSKGKADSDVSSQDHYELGKIVSARIVSQEENGYRLSLHSGKEMAFLPYSHLSDYREIQELRKQAMKPRLQLERVTYYYRRKQPIMTMKECFLQAAQQKQLLENFADLKSGQLLPAVIQNHEDYGIFLELAAGHTGLCPAKTLTNLQPANLQELFKRGQSVITRLAKIDSEKERFLGSLRVDECYEGGLEQPLTLLKNYLKSREDTLDLLFAEHEELSCYSDVKLGDVVQVTVSSVFKKGVLGELPSGAKALATKYHFGGVEPKEGQSYEAVVLFVDPLTPCVELTIEPRVVRAVKNRRENVKTQLKAEQVLKGDVLLVNPEFLLLGLRGHGAGKFVFVPGRKHMNDVEANPMYKVGTFTDVVIKEGFGDSQIGVLLMNDPAAKAKEEEELRKRKQAIHQIKPETFMEAKVKTVHPLQLNIAAGNLHGRVHISEAADDLKQGENPLRRFHPEQMIKVRVIGLRDVKSQSYLPVTKVKSSRTLLECTLKESKLKGKTKELLVPELDLAIGDLVWVFVIKVSGHKVWVQVGLSQQGYIDFFRVSEDMSVVNDATNRFLPGQALLATVLNNDDSDKLVLSLVGSDIKLEVGQNVTAQISSMKTDTCLHVKLPSGRLGVIQSKPSILHAVGQYIRCRVESVEGDMATLSLLEDSKGPVVQRKKRKRKSSVSEKTEEAEIDPEKALKKQRRLKKKMKKRRAQAEEQKDSGVDINESSSEVEEEENTSAAAVAASVTTSEEPSEAPARLSLPGFSWDGQLLKEHGEENGASGNEEDDDDDDTVAPESLKSRKKKKREEEKLIQEYERNQLEGNLTPQTAADYERLVLQSPHSSLVWLRYMSHHVELGELEKARAVAEKALETISFREEQEKLNVWLAYLNMETIYSEPKEVKRLLERAVQYNEPLNVYLKQCEMYVSAGKTEDAEQLYIVMTRKYKKDKSVWKSYAQFLFKADRIQSARNLLQRCITVLDKKDHVEIITRFATLEFSHGDAERGRTMFENLIASYPGRTDLWSVYVDMVAKVGDTDGARHILERAVKQKLNSKKLSFLLQKFVRFEESYGTEDQVQRVRDMAVELMDS